LNFKAELKRPNISTMQDISKLRKSYERAELSETDSAADPFKQFEGWLKEAISSELPEPNAMTLATVAVICAPAPELF
jgi:pyridoxamine 5'-phosphate oxidase